MNRFTTIAAIVLLSGFAANCAAPGPTTTKEASSPTAAGSGGAVSGAIGLLYEGRADEARKVLIKVLETYPSDTRAASLLQQINTPPEALLGTESVPYRVRRDDTLSSLAQRFLGDPTLFYALARYNQLTLPATLTPGQVLKIPGREKTPARKAAPAPRTAQPGAASSRPVQPPATVNAARATQLRAAGLEQLNRGNIDQAMALLRQALQNDPGNALIKRDLDRAVRIGQTVRSGR